MNFGEFFFPYSSFYFSDFRVFTQKSLICALFNCKYHKKGEQKTNRDHPLTLQNYYETKFAYFSFSCKNPLIFAWPTKCARTGHFYYTPLISTQSKCAKSKSLQKKITKLKCIAYLLKSYSHRILYL